MNNRPEGLTSATKLFPDDTSLLFFLVHDPKTTSTSLNEDLLKINNWLNPDVV